LRETVRLQPIGHGHALFERRAGAWRQMACLCFAGDTMRLVSNRSRMLQFRRG
jgi:hypothetical protein